MAETEYKNVGLHVVDLADGKMLAVGETAMLDEEAVRDPHNEDLIFNGVLIGTQDESAHEAQLAERRVANRLKKEEEQSSSTNAGEEG